MKYKLSLLFLLIISGTKINAQATTKIHTIYFDFDQYHLNETEKIKIDQFFSFDRLSMQKIELVGHTDAKGNNAYNITLSKNRVDQIQAYLVQKGISNDLISSNYEGEENPIQTNETDSGREKNRRVEIIVYFYEVQVDEILPPADYQEEIMEEVLEMVPESEPEPETDFIIPQQLDTILIVDDVQIVMSMNDYEKFKDCITITPIMNGEQALENRLTTMSVENDLMVSCGMINIKINAPCEDCFDKPLKIRFPAPPDRSCDFCNSRIAFNVAANGRWSRDVGNKIKKISINKKYYYEMLMECPGKKNCDCIKDYSPIKFKLPRKFEINQLNVYYDCPSANFVFTPNKNKAEGGTICQLNNANAFVYIETVYNQDTLQLKRIPLNQFKRSIFGACDSKWYLMRYWFRKKARASYRKKYRLPKSAVLSQSVPKE